VSMVGVSISYEVREHNSTILGSRERSCKNGIRYERSWV